MSQAFLRGFNQCVSSSIHSQIWVSQIAIYISLSHSQALHKIKGTPHLLANYKEIPHLSHSHQLSIKLKSSSSTVQPKELVDDSNGEWIYRRRSLHEMRERELILREISTKDGTTIPEGEGRPNLTQQPGPETSRRLTIGTNSPNLDRCKFIPNL